MFYHFFHIYANYWSPCSANLERISRTLLSWVIWWKLWPQEVFYRSKKISIDKTKRFLIKGLLCVSNDRTVIWKENTAILNILIFLLSCSPVIQHLNINTKSWIIISVITQYVHYVWSMFYGLWPYRILPIDWNCKLHILSYRNWGSKHKSRPFIFSVVKATIKPIDHQVYWPSSLWINERIG